jgi:hypothetical protein
MDIVKIYMCIKNDSSSNLMLTVSDGSNNQILFTGSPVAFDSSNGLKLDYELIADKISNIFMIYNNNPGINKNKFGIFSRSER